MNLYTNYSANLSDFHVVGHSLGGQIAGFVGKTVQNLTGLNIGKITGLDPANPLFVPTHPESRLANTDADIVVAVHTDGLIFGYYYPIGGIDFYANGGTAAQPGCLVEDFVMRKIQKNIRFTGCLIRLLLQRVVVTSDRMNFMWRLYAIAMVFWQRSVMIISNTNLVCVVEIIKSH